VSLFIFDRVFGSMLHNAIGPYKVIREIAEDRLGQVFEAVDSRRKKHVIIKSLRPEAAKRSEVISRLYSEAETVARLNHPHIARLLGFIRENDKLYLVMEFVAGESLRSILQEKGRLDFPLALAIFHQIIAAVRFAHELGVVHGNLKPSNIMVSSFAQIKVLDFAIAPILGNLNIHLVSSAPYMAPEQIRKGSIDARSDIYSLGVLLYESIVGRVPFTARTQEEALRAACKSTLLPPSLLVADCPTWLDTFLLRALAASPADRFQSVAAMSKAMGAAGAGQERTVPAPQMRGGFRRGARRLAFSPLTLTGKATRTISAFAKPLNDAAKIARHKQILAMASLRRKSMEAVSPWTWTWTKQGASMVQTWAHGMRWRVGAGAPAARSFPGKLKKRFAVFAENRWKRYAVFATVLASLMIETFIFGGANTLLSPGLNSLPALNHGGAGQSILAPLNPASPPAPAVDVNSEPKPKVLNRLNRGTRISEQTNRSAEDLHHGALNSKRTVTYRDAEIHSNRQVVLEVRVSEPAKRNPENTTVKPQLNVRWEN